MDAASDDAYNDIRGGGIFVRVRRVRRYIESAGAGIGNCGFQGGNRGRDKVVDRF